MRRIVTATMAASMLVLGAVPALAGPPERTPQEPQGCEEQGARPLEDYCSDDS